MQGFSNPYATKLRLSSNYIGKGHFNGKLFQVEWYPGALYEPGAPTLVHGEIYQLNSLEILQELDEYEDVLEDEAASLYVRKMVPVRNAEEVTIDCWVYLYNKPVADLPVIEDGYFKTTPSGSRR